MTKITKGTVVWLFASWDKKATVYARKMTITSWGAKRASAIYTETGEPADFRLYPEQDAGRVIPVADLPDPTEEGLRRAVRQKADGIAHYVERAHRYSSERDSYHEGMKRECEALMAAEPHFFIYQPKRSEPAA